ncbi:MAG: YtxH domain-containing protein [Clostridiaceae bacterium]
MRNRIITGMVLGAAATMLLMPDMDRNTKRKMRRANRYIRNSAEEAYAGMMRWMK